MEIDVTFTPADLRRTPLAGRTVVVVDIVRASTTMTQALDSGCRYVAPVFTMAAARRTAAALRAEHPLLGGERNRMRIRGFDLGNSPLEYTPEQVAGRPLVFTTSHGTAAINAARGAQTLLVGALVNLSAVVRQVLALGADVTLAAAGRGGRPVLDDTVGAGLLADRLAAALGEAATLTDAAQIARRGALSYEGHLLEMLYQSASGRDLERVLGPQGRADLAFCAQLSVLSTVPVLRDGVLVAE